MNGRYGGRMPPRKDKGMDTERLLERCILVLEAEVRSLQQSAACRARREPLGVAPVDQLLLRSKSAMLGNLRRECRRSRDRSR